MPEFSSVMIRWDLFYGNDTLMENVSDPSHIDLAHHQEWRLTQSFLYLAINGFAPSMCQWVLEKLVLLYSARNFFQFSMPGPAWWQVVPRWHEHWTSNKVYDGDMIVLQGSGEDIFIDGSTEKANLNGLGLAANSLCHQQFYPTIVWIVSIKLNAKGTNTLF
ncbi:hypothetical protein Csa_022799 [Cucumis sativus]|uniref:Pheophorbide a oxygenase domain-containing protein n=1 Tax=Cucumis sativus TaxID=3659 RepID=A0A0A0LST3_CUCSA|nr:hypothetical protein Csa_022799 [Cucumis sativus]